MKTRKILMAVLVGFVLLTIITPAPAQADGYYYYNSPLILPFLPLIAAGAVLGAAASIATAPFTPYPYYGPGYYPPPRYYAPPPPPRYIAAPGYYGPRPYGPYPYPRRAVWVPGHFVGSGEWIPGHWQ